MDEKKHSVSTRAKFINIGGGSIFYIIRWLQLLIFSTVQQIMSDIEQENVQDIVNEEPVVDGTTEKVETDGETVDKNEDNIENEDNIDTGDNIDDDNNNNDDDNEKESAKDKEDLQNELDDLNGDNAWDEGEANNNDEERQSRNAEEPIEQYTEDIEDEQTRKRREFEEKFNAILKKPTKKRKNNDVDLEAMQDEAISHLKGLMKEAAYLDIDAVNNKKPAINKLKLLPQVKDTLLKSNLYDSILDNNLLEAVRIWLEPLPDASLPSFEIQKALLNELVKMPIKTIHLRESGLGKVMVFYQKSKKVDNSLKRIAEKLIGDWTRPVMGRSDNYRARDVPTATFDIEKFNKRTKLQSSIDNSDKKNVRKSLYQESADRRKRAAAPEARTSVYTIAPQSNLQALQSQHNSVLSMGIGSSINRDERFKAINRKLTKLSQKKKNVKKDGVSIEGRGLNI